jgi:hypothetical protein
MTAGSQSPVTVTTLQLGGTCTIASVSAACSLGLTNGSAYTFTVTP